ncbi:MAG: hypothetical protein HOP29_10655 [Phycisphaerales bacterium]|nr:hypothetical protein [Phycisphaerales bacterium]
MVDEAFSFPSQNARVSIPHSPDLNPGAQGYSFDAWVKFTYTTGAAIASKTGGGRGFELRMDQFAPFPLVFQLLTLNLFGSGGSFTTSRAFPTSTISNGDWIHVAFTLNPGANVGRLFINGSVVDSFAINSLGSINGTGPLIIGDYDGSSGYPPFPAVDEVEVFNRPLSQSRIQAIFAAGAFGKCKKACHVPQNTGMCLNQNAVNVPVQICNYSTNPVAYDLSFSGLPTNVTTCTNIGPSTFVPINPASFLNFVVPPGCRPFVVQIMRPIGMTPGETACYEMSATLPGPGESRPLTCLGSLRSMSNWCAQAEPDIPAVVELRRNETGTASFLVTNNNDMGGVLAYEVAATPAGMDDANPVRLNGQAPGESVQGEIDLPIGGSAVISVNVELDPFEPFGIYDLVFYGNGDDDPGSEPLATMAVLAEPGGGTSIPTVSQWGLVVLTLGGLSMGTVLFGRRRTVPA